MRQQSWRRSSSRWKKQKILWTYKPFQTGESNNTPGKQRLKEAQGHISHSSGTHDVVRTRESRSKRYVQEESVAMAKLTPPISCSPGRNKRREVQTTGSRWNTRGIINVRNATPNSSWLKTAALVLICYHGCWHEINILLRVCFHCTDKWCTVGSCAISDDSLFSSDTELHGADCVT